MDVGRVRYKGFTLLQEELIMERARKDLPNCQYLPRFIHLVLFYTFGEFTIEIPSDIAS